MSPPNIKVRGAGRAKGIPTGYVLGRSASGSGDVQLLKISDLRRMGVASQNDVNSVLANTGVVAGTYGDATDIPVIVVGADGRITGLSTVPSAGGGASSLSPYKGYVPASVHNGTSPSAGFWSGVSIIMDEGCTITAISFLATTASPTTKSQAGVYADTGMKVDGGALLSTSAVITGVTAGINKITLTTPIVVTKGEIVWAGINWTVAAASVAAGNNQSAFFSASTPPNPASAANYAGSNLAIWLEK